MGFPVGQGKRSALSIEKLFTAHTVGALNVSCLVHLNSKLEVQNLGEGKRGAVIVPVRDPASLSYF